jgi:lysophospholipase L1-like esterase
VRNQGVSGDTTSDGLRRFDAALTAETAILVLELGANDGLGGVALSTIENNLSTMIERAQARGIRVLLCGMETRAAARVQLLAGLPRHLSTPRVPLSPAARCRSCWRASSSIRI